MLSRWSSASSRSSKTAAPSCASSSQGRERTESPSAEAERLLYFGLVGAIEEGLVETAEHVLTVLRQAHAPLGPMGEEWLKGQERGLEQ